MNYLIVAGGRDFNDPTLAFDSIDLKVTELGGPDNVTIIEGGAKGADYFGYAYALALSIPHKQFPADWKKHGRAAGPIRNAEMAEHGTHLLAFWDGKSRGTKNMIDTAKKKGLSVGVVHYEAS